MTACLLAGALAAAVPGELILTEQIYGAEGASYSDEGPADEVNDADVIEDISEEDIYGSADISYEEADIPYAEAEIEASFSDEETDVLSTTESGGLPMPDDDAEECPIELSTLFYEDYEHASGGIVPVIWNTSDNVSAQSELKGFTEEIVGAESLPASYINPVRSGIRNQDGNSCWVHSLTTSTEMSMISANLADELDYSERQILYGYFNQTGGDTGVPTNGYWAGAPGSPVMAAAAMANHIGLGDEDNFPANEGMTPLDIANDISHIEKVIFLGSWSDLKTKSLWKGSTWKALNESVKAAVMQYGSCAITCYSGYSSLNSSTHGFYTDWSGTDKPQPDHSLTVIGWDDNKVVADGVARGAFYVQNSWGSASPRTEKGYNWVSYYDASLGSATVYVPEHVSPGTLRDEDAFSHSGTGYTNELKGIAYTANVFEAEHDEIIDCVGIYTTAASKYQIYVTTKLTDNTDPSSGTIRIQQSGSVEGKGFFKIYLNKNMEVAAGDKFSVIVNLRETGSGNLTGTFEGPSNERRRTSCSAGQSYVYDNGRYIDCATGTLTDSKGKTINLKNQCGNACIFAYGNPKPEPTPTPTPQGPFPDVPYNHAFASAIKWAVDRGITKGYSDGTFGIDTICTRGHIMMFLWRYAGCPQPANVTKSPFKDVPKTHAFYKAILWGSQKGITKGYSDGTFGIDRDCTRGHIMTFIWRYKGCPKPKSTQNPFKDSITPAFRTAVIWSYEKKVAAGFPDGTFRDTKSCTRGEAVKFLYNLYLRT